MCAPVTVTVQNPPRNVSNPPRGQQGTFIPKFPFISKEYCRKSPLGLAPPPKKKPPSNYFAGGIFIRTLDIPSIPL